MNPYRALNVARQLAVGDEPANAGAFARYAGPTGPLAGITAICFLLDESELGTARLLNSSFPKLIVHLRRSTRPSRIELHGRLRGKIDWAATTKASASSDQNPALYVCRENCRFYNLIENQYAKHVLHEMAKCHRRMPGAVRRWVDEEGDPVSRRLAGIEQRVRRLLKSVYLRDVALPPQLTSEHELAALRTADPLYRRLVRYRRRLERVVLHPEWPLWCTVIERAERLMLDDDWSLLREMRG